jgi:SIS domain
MIALQLSEDRISFMERRNQIIQGLHVIPSQIKRVLEQDKSLQELATTSLSNQRSLLIMGRGYQHATCLEGALKIKEISYLHSEGQIIFHFRVGRPSLTFFFSRHPGWRIEARAARADRREHARHNCDDQRFVIPQGRICICADHCKEGAARCHLQ